jgi:hypothetical protein
MTLVSFHRHLESFRRGAKLWDMAQGMVRQKGVFMVRYYSHIPCHHRRSLSFQQRRPALISLVSGRENRMTTESQITRPLTRLLPLNFDSAMSMLTRIAPALFLRVEFGLDSRVNTGNAKLGGADGQGLLGKTLGWRTTNGKFIHMVSGLSSSIHLVSSQTKCLTYPRRRHNPVGVSGTTPTYPVPSTRPTALSLGGNVQFG